MINAFAYQKLGYVLEGLDRENAGTLYGRLVHLMARLYIFCSLVKHFSFWYVAPIKIWQPCLNI
jgi:hypothetical protein